jgi:hypothetical protein
MEDNDFFTEIEHTPVTWRVLDLCMPVFYQQMAFISVMMLAPLERIKAVLPSTRLHPYRATPGQGLISISAYRYHECDIGPYNEVGLGIPVTLDTRTPLFTGLLRKPPETLTLYSYHLPVSTEIAREVGVEFAGYPKFVAEIEFTDQEKMIVCTLSEKGSHILTLNGRALATGPAGRFRVELITERNGYLLRSELVMSEHPMGVSSGKGDVTLELGDHPMAQDIRDLNPGKIVQYLDCPRAQPVLTPPLKSYASS